MWSAFLLEMSPEEMTAVFRRHDFVCSELSDEHSAALLKRGNPEKTGAALKKFAGNLGFSFPQGHLFLSIDIALPNESRRRKNIDTLKRWLELYSALGVKAAVLHPGGAETKSAAEKKRQDEARLKSLRELCAFAKGGPVTICLENLMMNYRRAGDLVKTIKDCGSPSNLGICLDTGHLNVTKGDQTEFIKKAGKLLKALHIADNLGSYDDHLLPFGKGTVDWPAVMSALKKNGYNGLFNFEVPGERRCPPEVREAKLDYALALANAMLKMD
jgi:sugar phosphate isomerase/epimerase